MTEYEYLDLISTYRGENGFHVMNFVVVMFGYVAAAYFVGDKLTNFQVTAITILYTIFTNQKGFTVASCSRLKRVFGFNKVRYRGLDKNATRLFVACALVNLLAKRCRRRKLLIWNTLKRLVNPHIHLRWFCSGLSWYWWW